MNEYWIGVLTPFAVIAGFLVLWGLYSLAVWAWAKLHRGDAAPVHRSRAIDTWRRRSTVSTFDWQPHECPPSDEEKVTEVKPLHVVLAAPILEEAGPIATNPILRGVDLAMDRLVRTNTFTERTIRVLDALRAEVIGVETPEELRAHYLADRGSDDD